jgi:hypothetical protein
MLRLHETMNKTKIKEMGEKHEDRRRKMRKKKQVKEKTRLACETRCAQTLITVYPVLACGVVATWL